MLKETFKLNNHNSNTKTTEIQKITSKICEDKLKGL